MPNLTNTRIEAIIEALIERLAGELDTDVSREEYEKALEWAKELWEDRSAGHTVRRVRRSQRKVVPPLGREA